MDKFDSGGGKKELKPIESGLWTQLVFWHCSDKITGVKRRLKRPNIKNKVYVCVRLIFSNEDKGWPINAVLVYSISPANYGPPNSQFAFLRQQSSA